MKDEISEYYVQNAVSIKDVTELAHKVQDAHSSKNKDNIELLADILPNERSYIPTCSKDTLENLGMLPGFTAQQIAQIGRGKATS